MEEKKYTRDQIKDAIWQELKDSDYAGENNDRAYEIIGIVMAGIDKIASGTQPGPVWVKASEFKYEVGMPYHAKDNQYKGAGCFNIHGYFKWGDGSITENTRELYILDESGTAAPNSEQDAHEKEVMMRAFHNVKQIFEGRKWIMEGRGCYPYDDDRYKEEVRYMYDEFDQVFNDTWCNIKSKSIEYREWIIKVYLKNDHPAIHDILKRLGYRKVKESEAKSDNSEQGAIDLFKQQP